MRHTTIRAMAGPSELWGDSVCCPKMTSYSDRADLRVDRFLNQSFGATLPDTSVNRTELAALKGCVTADIATALGDSVGALFSPLRATLPAPCRSPDTLQATSDMSREAQAQAAAFSSTTRQLLDRTYVRCEIQIFIAYAVLSERFGLISDF